MADATRLHLNPQVSVRAERFGALCYNFDSRDLFLIKSPYAVELAELARAGIDRDQAAGELATRGVGAKTFQVLVSALLDRKVLLAAGKEADAGNE